MRPFPCLDGDVDPIVLPGFARTPSAARDGAPGERRDPALHRLRRERAAVLIGDIAGYSRLIERDDLNTVVRLRQLRRHLIEPAMAQWGARIVRLAGDGLFSVFAEAAAAVDCAVAVQRGLAALEPACPPTGGCGCGSGSASAKRWSRTAATSTGRP